MAPSCTQPACPFTKTGQCLEGLTPAECPNYNAEGVVVPIAPVAARAKDAVELPRGAALDPGGTYDVGRDALPRVVLLAGEQRCGKTTLVASLYELFQEDHVGAYAFAGSKTLPAFEERCHDARIASNRSSADTERTKPGEGLRFLHLCLQNIADRRRQHLLLGDMSGELYDTLRDSSDECRKYLHIGRADHFVAMLNGAKVASGDHSDAYTQTRGLVRALIDAEVLHARCNLWLVTTKWDLIKNDEEAKHRVAELEKDFKRRFAGKLPCIDFAHVAARPEPGALSFGTGVSELLASWMERDGLPQRTAFPTKASSRHFDLFGAG